MSTAVKTAPKETAPKTTTPKEVVSKEVVTKEAIPVDEAFWDSAVLAALAGASSEVRLTADEIVRKAVNCADKMIEARELHLNPPVPPVVEGDLGTVNIAPTSDSVAATAETSSFAVTVVDPGSWTAVSSDPSWLSVVSPTTPQTVDGDVNFAATANTGAARTGTITVNTRTFTVVQSGV
jgi:hypothetical protein